MAINLSKPFTFTPNTVILSASVNADFDTLYTLLNALDAGSSSFTQLLVDANPTTALQVATKQYVDQYAAYRRPTLTWISATQVDVENNTGTANQTSIQFSDGQMRTVTENTSSTNQYRRFDITATAEFTTGTEESGLYSGLSEANNTWYALYAVKSQINTANFVLVGDTTFPVQANYATLNSRYAANGWYYLGPIRNGNNAGTVADILAFTQSGNHILFRNEITAANMNVNINVGSAGIRLATTASASSLTYSYSSGTGATDIPPTVRMVDYLLGFGVVNGRLIMSTQSGSQYTIQRGPDGGTDTKVLQMRCRPAVDGMILSNSAGTLAYDILLNGIYDHVLTQGSNPLL